MFISYFVLNIMIAHFHHPISQFRQVEYQISCPMTKPTKWHVRPAKTQISLGIRPVWSKSSLSAWRKLGFLATHWAHSKDSDQTGRMPRLIWVFAGRTVTLLVLSCHGSNGSEANSSNLYISLQALLGYTFQKDLLLLLWTGRKKVEEK